MLFQIESLKTIVEEIPGCACELKKRLFIRLFYIPNSRVRRTQ